ncbi:hypothetical protein BJX64DRAFT_292900 [Aspergillus heterothallicus]
MNLKSLFGKKKSKKSASESMFPTSTPFLYNSGLGGSHASPVPVPFSSEPRDTSSATRPTAFYPQQPPAYNTTHYQNQTPAFTAELNSQTPSTTISPSSLNHRHYYPPALAPTPPQPPPPPPSQTPASFAFSHSTYTHSQRYAAPSSHPSHIPSSGPTPAMHRPQRQATAPTCRNCNTILSFKRVRKYDKGRIDRPYYRCDKCGEFRMWADAHGVSRDNPDCKCGNYTRLQRSNAGIMFFSCASGSCNFYAEGDWRDQVGGGSFSGRMDRGGSVAYSFQPRAPEMVGDVAWVR